MEIPALKEILNRSTIQDPSQKAHKKPVQIKEVEVGHRESIKMVAKEQEETVRQLAETLNQFMKNIGYNLQFIPDRETGIVIIKVLDGNGKMIRQIPPEAIQSLSSKIGESIGVLLNSKL